MGSLNQNLTRHIQNALASGQNGVMSARPFVSNSGPNAGKLVVVANAGFNDDGTPKMVEKVIAANAGNSSLRQDDWINIDSEILRVAKQRMPIISSLMSSGLTYNAGDLGTMTVEWDLVSNLTDARVTMDGGSQGDKDRQEFGTDGVPIPIIHKEFSLPLRQLLASRRNGAALDTTHAEAAGESVARKSEQIVIFGHNVASKGRGGAVRTIPGMLSHPERETINGLNWTDAAVTGEQILSDILLAIRTAETDGRAYGPFKLIISGKVAYRFREDFKAMGDKTLMDRVMAIPEIEDVLISDQMPGNRVVLQQWTRSSIDLAVISDINTIRWEEGSQWLEDFQVFAAWAPRLKADFDGHMGLVDMTLVGASA